ncbi:ankyrin repeat protein [Chthoniobacter flavus Ellin428]|uniref:Ankyrin repeat protein n=2 Tax=Chthoniobacter flavus TaxID=191863 RepID=B4CU40_9BACT|nr:ankyrin repeat protein [Chthoniobacter flavus Ellin428]TCO94885.1 ankyrin repeat protein [Chthoniobacter flavus]
MLCVCGPLAGAEDLLSLAEKGFHHDELRKELRASPQAALTLRDADQRTALHMSAMHGQFEDVFLLLEAGARIDVVDKAGYTPLRYALEGRQRAYGLLCAQVLVAGGANINRVDENGSTPLAIAVANGFRPAVEFLISQGAVVEPKEVPPEQQPLTIALRRNDAEMIALLEKAKTWAAKKSPDTSNRPDKVDARFLAAVRAGDIPLVVDLIQQGAVIDTADADGATALYIAVKEHRAEMVSLLLYNGADPNRAKNDGMTPLMASMPFFDIKGTGVFLMLIQFGADVNAVTKDGRTPLSEAVAARNNFTAKWCIWRGAKLDVKTKKGTLMQIAKARPDWPSMIDVLKKEGVADDEALPVSATEAAFNAVRAGDIAAVEEALKDGVAVDVTDDVGAPMLAWAAHYKRLDIVDLLLKHGANVDQRNAKTSKTALQEFALYGKDGNDGEAAERMQELLDRGADPNVVTKDGDTALMIAARTGTKGENLMLLLKLTKDLNARNKDGKTALGLAREYGNQDVAEILVSHGAVE